MATFGSNVVEIRQRLGISAVELAGRLGVGAGQLSNWEHDRFGVPNGTTLMKFAVALRCPIEALIWNVDENYTDLRTRARADDWAKIGRVRSELVPYVRARVDDGTMTPDEALRMVVPLVEAVEKLLDVVVAGELIRAPSDDNLNEADRKILEMWNGLEPSAQTTVRDLLVHLYAARRQSR